MDDATTCVKCGEKAVREDLMGEESCGAGVVCHACGHVCDDFHVQNHAPGNLGLFVRADSAGPKAGAMPGCRGRFLPGQQTGTAKVYRLVGGIKTLNILLLTDSFGISFKQICPENVPSDWL